MASLNDLINLAKADGGKFFVIDEAGEPKLVIMSIEQYQQMLLGKLQKQILDVETINEEILKAQLNDEPAITSTSSPIKGPTLTNKSRAQANYSPISKNDLRAEVIDPSFDFEGPKVEIDDL